jgi:hypothetical protein
MTSLLPPIRLRNIKIAYKLSSMASWLDGFTEDIE